MARRDELFQGYGESTYGSTVGFFRRMRGALTGEATSIVLTVISMSDLPLWLKIPASALPYIRFVFIAVLVLSLGGLLLYVVRLSTLSFNLRRDARIWSSAIAERLEKGEEVTLRTVARLCAEGAVRTFDSFTVGHKHIGSAVRLYVGEEEAEDKQRSPNPSRDCEDSIEREGTGGSARQDVKEKAYKTIVRAGILSPRRERTSEPLSDKSYLLKTLAQPALERYPVLICNNVPLAQEREMLEKDKNSSLYADEIRSMMVVRLYAWDKSNLCRSQMGLLYVTSNKVGWFKAEHVDIAISIANMFECLILAAMPDGVEGK